MKKAVTVIICLFCFFRFSVISSANEEIYGDIFDFFSDDAVSVLESFGINGDEDGDFFDITPIKALETVWELFTKGFSDIISAASLSLILIFITALVSGILPQSGSLFFMGKSVAVMTVMFSLVSFTGEIFTECASALLVTRDFMLTLIPIFTGVIAVSGNPALSVSFNSVVFSFGEGVALLFQRVVPVMSAVLTAVCTAGAINPYMKLQGIGRTLSKGITLLMAFVSGIFVAVLSVRGVIAGAADSVTIRGMRFLIGNTVPVVGSAIGEALNSVVAGIGLIKSTVGMLGIAGIIVINLPVFINIILWKGVLYVMGIAADITGCEEIKGFSENLSSVISLITGALCFVSFVFIISIAIILTVSRA